MLGIPVASRSTEWNVPLTNEPVALNVTFKIALRARSPLVAKL